MWVSPTPRQGLSRVPEKTHASTLLSTDPGTPRAHYPLQAARRPCRWPGAGGYSPVPSKAFGWVPAPTVRVWNSFQREHE